MKCKKLFVTGTGTDIGKTYVTSLIVKKLNQLNLNPCYYKAAVSGNSYDKNGYLVPGDAKFVKDVSKIAQSLESMCPYVYENAVSPHLASRIEGNPVDIDTVINNFNKLSSKYEYLTMEGSGGITCPIDFDTKEVYLWELVKKLNLSCVIVADAGLGTINNVVLTVEYLRLKNINIKGIIFNNYHKDNIIEKDNWFMCEHMTNVKILGYVEENGQEIIMSDNALISMYE